jgi:hypothetical protein
MHLYRYRVSGSHTALRRCRALIGITYSATLAMHEVKREALTADVVACNVGHWAIAQG